MEKVTESRGLAAAGVVGEMEVGREKKQGQEGVCVCVQAPAKQHVLDAYNFQLLHSLLAHVHPSRLLHLNQAQVLATQKENRVQANWEYVLSHTPAAKRWWLSLFGLQHGWLISQHAFLPPPPRLIPQHVISCLRMNLYQRGRCVPRCSLSQTVFASLTAIIIPDHGLVPIHHIIEIKGFPWGSSISLTATLSCGYSRGRGSCICPFVRPPRQPATGAVCWPLVRRWASSSSGSDEACSSPGWRAPWYCRRGQKLWLSCVSDTDLYVNVKFWHLFNPILAALLEQLIKCK